MFTICTLDILYLYIYNILYTIYILHTHIIYMDSILVYLGEIYVNITRVLNV